jgi:hypothetical protein
MSVLLVLGVLLKAHAKSMARDNTVAHKIKAMAAADRAASQGKCLKSLGLPFSNGIGNPKNERVVGLRRIICLRSRIEEVALPYTRLPGNKKAGGDEYDGVKLGPRLSFCRSVPIISAFPPLS